MVVSTLLRDSAPLLEESPAWEPPGPNGGMTTRVGRSPFVRSSPLAERWNRGQDRRRPHPRTNRIQARRVAGNLRCVVLLGSTRFRASGFAVGRDCLPATVGEPERWQWSFGRRRTGDGTHPMTGSPSATTNRAVRFAQRRNPGWCEYRAARSNSTFPAVATSPIRGFSQSPQASHHARRNRCGCRSAAVALGCTGTVVLQPERGQPWPLRGERSGNLAPSRVDRVGAADRPRRRYRQDRRVRECARGCLRGPGRSAPEPGCLNSNPLAGRLHRRRGRERRVGILRIIGFLRYIASHRSFDAGARFGEASSRLASKELLSWGRSRPWRVRS